ncbi:hypothetical protein [Sphaerisporangium sp. TRM90804]|uniref:hypothetical protein n=1 Tax=Sphaerisporangium sp. TRM90804 TaxID=3031113 RepID=UPI002448654C|nr:hypothetical protein [Sphaerisporangium sp. TRM90804]MDH2424730.1 hypothetical protein [Sphaerisporangium sp. TRM90804]
MPEYDPQRDGPYAEWLKDKGVRQSSRTYATKDEVTVHRDDEGRPVAQTVRDQNGHETTEHASGRRDVRINLGSPGGDY